MQHGQDTGIPGANSTRSRWIEPRLMTAGQEMREPPYKFMVRLPVSMRDLIEQSARHYRRSLNSDIVARLHHSFSGLPDQEQGLAPPLHDQFEAVFRRELSAEEEALIRGFRCLSQAKREALLCLLL